MIPKIIHFCWFGMGEKPQIAKSCMESWERHLPEYELREWNEDNFDVTSNRYAKEAYESRLYAFVTDYVRLYALYNCGGIYMDTDVEVLRPLDRFLSHAAFSGFEDGVNVPTGIMGSEKGCQAVRDLMLHYEGKSFKKKNASCDTTTNCAAVTGYFLKHGLVQDNTLQTVNGMTFYPREFFCPKNLKSTTTNVTEDTYVIHHFAGSWLPVWKKRRAEVRKKIRLFLAGIFGPESL
ncbi:MAG: glycosyl transferase [Synergistaceae bacterium]|jgi:mannosyltransferase OCH1-like enzyme|nr:glycosyl transferase [Synergistaceae bacterium]